MSLSGKIALITGASSGIGRSTAKYLAKEGVNLLLVARRKDKLDALAQELESQFSIKIKTYQLDVRELKEITVMMESLEDEWKSIDILINNAGLALGKDPFQDTPLEDAEIMINTNIKGLVYMTKAFLPYLLKKNKGDIINIGSTAGDFAYPGGAVYSGTKAMVKNFSDGLRTDLVNTDIRVTNVKPGLIETDFSIVRFKGDKERAEGAYSNHQALNGDDVASVITAILAYPPHIQITEIGVFPNRQGNAMVYGKK